MENRLTELEIKLSFTEDLVEELNRTVYQQQRQIDALLQAMLNMRQQMASMIPEEKRSLRDELPPHY
jgi:SlyX protein